MQFFANDSAKVSIFFQSSFQKSKLFVTLRKILIYGCIEPSKPEVAPKIELSKCTRT